MVAPSTCKVSSLTPAFSRAAAKYFTVTFKTQDSVWVRCECLVLPAAYKRYLGLDSREQGLLRLSGSLLANFLDLTLNSDWELVAADFAHPSLVVVVAAALLPLLPLPHDSSMAQGGCYLAIYSGTNPASLLEEYVLLPSLQQLIRVCLVTVHELICTGELV